MNVTLRQLRAALAVARHQNFRRAAEEVSLSGPALSLAIGELERSLGARLFDRTSRMVRTTELGQAFLPEAQRLVGELGRLIEQVGLATESRKGRVVVTCLPTIAARLIPEVLVACRERYPAVEVVVRDDLATSLLDVIRLGDADLAVAVDVNLASSELLFEPLASEALHAVFRKDHPFAQKKRIRWKDLAGQSVVGFLSPSTMQPLAENELERQGIRVAGRFAVSQLATVHGMIDAGLGVGVMPTLSLPSDSHPSMAHCPLVAPAVRRTIGVLRRRDRSLSPAAEAFYQVLKEKTSRTHGLPLTVR